MIRKNMNCKNKRLFLNEVLILSHFPETVLAHIMGHWSKNLKLMFFMLRTWTSVLVACSKHSAFKSLLCLCCLCYVQLWSRGSCFHQVFSDSLAGMSLPFLNEPTTAEVLNKNNTLTKEIPPTKHRGVPQRECFSLARKRAMRQAWLCAWDVQLISQ